MNDFSLKLSAYLDGELDDDEARLIEEQLSKDPALQAEMDAFLEANTLAEDCFETMLTAPVPLSVAQMIKTAEAPVVQNSEAGTSLETNMNDNQQKVVRLQRQPIWRSIAASFLVFILGGAGGYSLHNELAQHNGAASKSGWLMEIADYHAIYATEKRHLVEVSGDQKGHIEKWLGKKTGAGFRVPDLSSVGLTFEGGRLLVADGRPVAQLIYRDSEGTVVALCLQKMAEGMVKDNNKTEIVAADMKSTSIKGFDFLSWGTGPVHYVVIGPKGKSDLEKIAVEAARHV